MIIFDSVYMNFGKKTPLSMLIRQMKKDAITYDKDFDKMTQKLGELLRPVVYNGIMPIIKKHIKE